jgi:hypothetical protein
VRAFLLPASRSRLVPGFLLLGLSVHAVPRLRGDVQRDVVDPELRPWVLAGRYVLDVPSATVFGTVLPGDSQESARSLIFAVAAVAVVGAMGGLAARDRSLSGNTAAAVMCASAGALLFVAAVAVSGIVPPRYLISPSLLLLSALLLVVQDRAHRSRWLPERALLRAGVIAVLAAVTVGWVLSLRPTNERSPGPAWRTELSAAVDVCRAQSWEGGAYVTVPPTGGLEWRVFVPCRKLR